MEKEISASEGRGGSEQRRLCERKDCFWIRGSRMPGKSDKDLGNSGGDKFVSRLFIRERKCSGGLTYLQGR